MPVHLQMRETEEDGSSQRDSDHEDRERLFPFWRYWLHMRVWHGRHRRPYAGGRLRSLAARVLGTRFHR
jgi:hypothetical protein